MEYLQFEAAYNKIIPDIEHCCPDGIMTVTIDLLQSLGLIENGELKKEHVQWLNLNFHVVESIEKITLYNKQYVVWVVPRMEGENTLTYTIVARHDGRKEKCEVELVFTASGVYNEPHYILRVLGGFLMEMQENDTLISELVKGK